MGKKIGYNGRFWLTVFLGAALVVLVIALGLRFFTANSHSHSRSKIDLVNKQTELASIALEMEIDEFQESIRNFLVYAQEGGLEKAYFASAANGLFTNYKGLIDSLYVSKGNQNWLFYLAEQDEFISIYNSEDGSNRLTLSEGYYFEDSIGEVQLQALLNPVQFTDRLLNHYYLDDGGAKLLLINGELTPLRADLDWSITKLNKQTQEAIQADLQRKVQGIYEVEWEDEAIHTEGVLVQYPLHFGSMDEDAALLFFVKSESINERIYETYFWYFFGFVVLLIGTILFFVISLRNKIDAQRLIETSAQEISELFDQQNLLLKELKGFFFFHNYKGEITSVSQEVEKILGHSKEDFLNAFNPENTQQDAELVKSKVVDAINSNESAIDLEYDFIRPDGVQIRLRIFEKLVYDDLGRFDGGVGICTDITGQYHQKQELIESGNRLQTLIDNIPDIIFLYDNEGKILLSHVQNQKNVIQEWDDLVGKNLQDAIPVESREQALKAFRKARLTGQIQMAEFSVELLKSFQYFEMRFFPLDANKMMSIAKDITNQRNWENGLIETMKAADQANRSKSEFLANMSHEIRTPLNGLLGIIDLLDLTELDKTQKQYLDIIKGSGNSLLSIIKDILDYSKIEAGKLELNSMVFNPVEEIKRQVQIFYGLAKQKDVQIHTDFGANTDVLLEGDAEKINQVILNLVGNAVKFTAQGGEVNVKLSLEDISNELKYLTCAIQDNGIGISEVDLQNLTDPFFQIESSNSRTYQGTGLGLAIAKKLIELMGGELKITSTVNVGSEFSFTVIVKSAIDKTDLYLNSQYSDITNWVGMAEEYPMHILLAEDNELNLQLMTLIFEQLGYSFDTAKNGVEALEMVKRNEYDLVFMDVQMPEMNGLEATQKIRELGDKSDVYIVGLSANVFDEDQKKAMEVGMNDYLVKPIRLDSLAKKIKKYALRMLG